MKNKIIINISKDTPQETVKELAAALKTGKPSKRNKQSDLYLLNKDIEKLHERYEQLFKQVKTSLNLSEKQIEKECETLSEKYDFELEELSKLRKADYENRLTEIKERERNIKAWRRCWLWRLLFQPLTNRAQDIIEARAELEADIIHTDEEKAIENDRRKFKADNAEKLSKRKLKRLMRDKLKAVIEKADNADVNEAFAEPPDVPTVQENAAPTTAAPIGDTEPAEQRNNVESTQAQEQTPQQEQLRLDVLPNVRKARPPRSCRRP